MTQLTHFHTHTHAEANDLFLSYQNGNIDTLGELYLRYSAYVLKHIKQSNAFSCPHDCEDTASEVWIHIQTDASRWDLKKSGWQTFLDYKIKLAIDRAVKHRTAEKRQTDYNAVSLNGDPTVANSLFSDEPTPLDLLIFKERVEAVKKAIRWCKFSRRVEAVMLLRLAGFSNKAVAKQLRISQSYERLMFYSAIHRIRKKVAHLA